MANGNGLIPKDGGKTTARPAGYSLIELVVVTAILSILALIVVPRLGQAVRVANEGATKQKLASVRTALGVYYADAEGNYPSDLTPLLQPGSKYLTGFIPFYTAEHGNNSVIDYVSAFDPMADTGNWGYVASGPDQGRVWVECTHTDAKGSVWTQY